MTPAQLDQKRQQHSDVPCNGCTACCRSDRIVLHPQFDRHDDYRHHLEPHAGGQVRVLDRKDNGDCTYLTDTGCSIKGKAPEICKRFDCRVLLLITPTERQAIRVAQNAAMAHVYAAGAERLHTLTGTPS